jgi:hypothetical protein
MYRLRKMTCVGAFLAVAMAGGCGDSSGAPPSGPWAATPAPASVAALSPTSISAMVGQSIEELPAVIVRDAQGNPSPDVWVAFAILTGGGSIIASSVKTDAQGIARLARWTLGTSPGLNTVMAKVGSLPAVTFAASAAVGPLFALKKLGGDDQVAAPGSVLAIQPTVRVVDAFDNGIAGVTVRFLADPGSGTLSAATVVSNANGVAALGGWTLGTSAEQRITATAGGLPPVTFFAAAVSAAPSCASSGSLTAGQVVTSKLTAQSCLNEEGRLLQTYAMVVAEQGAYQFDLFSSEFDTYLEIRDARDNPVARSEEGSAPNALSHLMAFLSKGAYTVVASTARKGAQGQFRVTYSRGSGEVSGCGVAFIVRGATSGRQALTGQDCVVPSGGSEDRFRIWLTAGRSTVIRLEDWSYSDHYFEVSDSNGKVLGASEYVGGYEYGVTFAPPADGYYDIRVLGDWHQGLEYELKVP